MDARCASLPHDPGDEGLPAGAVPGGVERERLVAGGGNPGELAEIADQMSLVGVSGVGCDLPQSSGRRWSTCRHTRSKRISWRPAPTTAARPIETHPVRTG
jgi:hypothetical protein